MIISIIIRIRIILHIYIYITHTHIYIYILTIRGMVNPVQLKDQLYVIRTLESALRSYFGRPGTSVPLGSIKTPRDQWQLAELLIPYHRFYSTYINMYTHTIYIYIHR